MDFLVPLGYKDLFNEPATRELVESLTKSINWKEAITRSIGIGAISFLPGIEEDKQQNFLASALTKGLLYGPAIERALAINSHRQLITRDGLLAVLRSAFIYRSEGDDSVNFADMFTRANLAANEVVLEEINIFGEGTSSSLLGSELRSPLLKSDNQHEVLARTSALFNWIESEAAKASDNYLPLQDDLKKFTGLTWLEHVACSYALISRTFIYKTWDDARTLGVWFKIEDWLHDFKTRNIVEQWFKVCSVDIEEAVKQWKSEPSLSLAGFGPLWKQPVIRENEWFCVPYPPLLTNAMGDGLYFTLLDSYSEEDKLKFMPLFGEFFEDYIVERLSSAYQGRDNILQTAEVPYGNGLKSSDYIVLENGDLILFEVVAKRMNFKKSILGLEKAAIDEDLKLGVLEKIVQLDRNAKDFQDKAFLADWPRKDGMKIFPVLVAPKEWPRIYAIEDYLPREMGDLLKGCEPLEMLSAHDIELLEAMVSKGGYSLSQLLIRKNGGGVRHHRLMSLHDYLLEQENQGVPFNDTPTRAAGGLVAKEIIALVTSWQ